MNREEVIVSLISRWFGWGSFTLTGVYTSESDITSFVKGKIILAINVGEDSLPITEILATEDFTNVGFAVKWIEKTIKTYATQF